MLSAKEMCAIATSSTKSHVLIDIENKMREAANNGEFFIKLFDVKSGTDSVQCAIMDKYGSDVYRTLERLGYVTAIYDDGITPSVYIGFAHTSDKVLLVDIAKSKR